MKAEKVSMEQWVEWLQHESHLRGLDREECRLVGSLLQPVHVRVGECLFEQGESNQELFLIKNGHVNVGHPNKPHQWIDMGPYGEVDFCEDEVELKDKIILGPGDCVGESSLFSNHSHSLTAIATEEGELFSLQACKLPVISNCSPHVLRCFTELLNRNLSYLRVGC